MPFVHNRADRCSSSASPASRGDSSDTVLSGFDVVLESPGGRPAGQRPYHEAVDVRVCGFCGEGRLRVTSEQALRGGGRQTTWTCAECGQSVKLLSPLGRFTLGALALFMTGAVPYVAVTDKVSRESERPWMVLFVAALAAALICLFVLDGRRQRRHAVEPRVGR